MKRMGWGQVCLMALCAVTAFCSVAPAAAQEVPMANCFYAGVPPVIDGKGDDAVWEGAVRLDLVDVADLNRSPHTYSTQGRVLWDHTALYVLIEATDPDVWSTLNNRDDPLYNEEVVELFIDPDGDGRNYMEIEINPVGTVFDLLVTRALRQGGTGLPEWNPELQTAVSIDGSLNDPGDVDGAWRAEIALPWTALQTPLLDVSGTMSLPPIPGDRWRLNLYRYERLRRGGDETGVIEYSAWSPVGRIDFHAPDRFGVIVFADERTAIHPMSWAGVKGGH